MNKAKLYALRKKRKRWLKELEGFEAELAEKLEHVKKHGRWSGLGTVEYPQGRIRILKAQLEEIDKLDLRTDEEKRGYNRKEYVRTKDIELRGVDDATVKQINREIATLVKSIQKNSPKPGEPVSGVHGSIHYETEMSRAYALLQKQLEPETRYKRPGVPESAGPGARGAYLTDKGKEIQANYNNVIVPEIDSRFPEVVPSARERAESEAEDLIRLKAEAVNLRRESRRTKKAATDPSQEYPATARHEAALALARAEEATKRVADLSNEIQQDIEAGGEHAKIAAERERDKAAKREQKAFDKKHKADIDEYFRTH